MLSKSFLRQLGDSFLVNRPLDLVFCCRSSPASVKRAASSSSSTRWKTRQANDHFAREARVQGLKSRAAFKLLQINDKHKLFKRGNTVVDLGYAPGSWSQVAVNRTAPDGRIIGVDILPATPPKGVSTIQGDFLSPDIQAEVRSFVQDPTKGRTRRTKSLLSEEEDDDDEPNDIELEEKGYIDMERSASQTTPTPRPQTDPPNRSGGSEKDTNNTGHKGQRERDTAAGRVVDVVLSDMCAPWEQTSGFHKRSISDPYHRMMNTSGMTFRDHAGSMDLCTAALHFAYDTLRTGGHFVCKFYQGAEDKLLEKKLRKLFEKVQREKPAASRSESKESYFIALKRKDGPGKDDVFVE